MKKSIKICAINTSICCGRSFFMVQCFTDNKKEVGKCANAAPCG